MLEVQIENIIPVTEARDNFNQIVDKVESTDDMFVFTKNGKPCAILVGVHHMEKLTGESHEELFGAGTSANKDADKPAAAEEVKSDAENAAPVATPTADPLAPIEDSPAPSAEPAPAPAPNPMPDPIVPTPGAATDGAPAPAAPVAPAPIAADTSAVAPAPAAAPAPGIDAAFATPAEDEEEDSANTNAFNLPSSDQSTQASGANDIDFVAPTPAPVNTAAANSAEPAPAVTADSAMGAPLQSPAASGDDSTQAQV